MTTIMILEDNIMQLNALAEILETNLEKTHILKAPDYNTATALLTAHNIHFFLLDVELEMGDPEAKTGIDFGKHIRSLSKYRFTPILYITSIPNQIQVAVNDIHCQNYILKPYTTDELLKAIHFLYQTPFFEPEPLKICDHSGVFYKIKEKDILFIEAAGKEMYLYIEEKNEITKITTTRYRLTEFKTMLSDCFIQCHKKYLVNMHHISSYDKSTSSIHINRFFLSVGRKYKLQFENHYF